MKRYVLMFMFSMCVGVLLSVFYLPTSYSAVPTEQEQINMLNEIRRTRGPFSSLTDEDRARVGFSEHQRWVNKWTWNINQVQVGNQKVGGSRIEVLEKDRDKYCVLENGVYQMKISVDIPTEFFKRDRTYILQYYSDGNNWYVCFLKEGYKSDKVSVVSDWHVADGTSVIDACPAIYEQELLDVLYQRFN